MSPLLMLLMVTLLPASTLAGSGTAGQEKLPGVASKTLARSLLEKALAKKPVSAIQTESAVEHADREMATPTYHDFISQARQGADSEVTRRREETTAEAVAADSALELDIHEMFGSAEEAQPSSAVLQQQSMSVEKYKSQSLRSPLVQGHAAE
mmetsp:Transcript_28655/g.52163  ORF Transcript_28655/g.52163 Transcript_28655/m.52163 type:complete len:153 (+) Transcript_28655:88-546(+)